MYHAESPSVRAVLGFVLWFFRVHVAAGLPHTARTPWDVIINRHKSGPVRSTSELKVTRPSASRISLPTDPVSLMSAPSGPGWASLASSSPADSKVSSSAPASASLAPSESSGLEVRVIVVDRKVNPPCSFKVYVLTLLMLCATRMKPLLSERVRTWDVLLY